MPASIQNVIDTPEHKQFVGFSAQIGGEQIKFTLDIQLRSKEPITDTQLSLVMKALDALTGNGALTRQELLETVSPELATSVG